MKIVLDVPDYDGESIDVVWEHGAVLSIKVWEKDVVVSANKTALMSLGKQLIYLANNDLPQGSHVHYDSFFTQQEQEHELIIERRDNR